MTISTRVSRRISAALVGCLAMLSTASTCIPEPSNTQVKAPIKDLTAYRTVAIVVADKPGYEATVKLLRMRLPQALNQTNRFSRVTIGPDGSKDELIVNVQIESARVVGASDKVEAGEVMLDVTVALEDAAKTPLGSARLTAREATVRNFGNENDEAADSLGRDLAQLVTRPR